MDCSFVKKNKQTHARALASGGGLAAGSSPRKRPRVPPRLLSSSYLRVRDGGLALVRWIRVGSRPLAHDGVAVDPINGN